MSLKDTLYQLTFQQLLLNIKSGNVEDIDSIRMKHKKDGTIKYKVVYKGETFKFSSKDLEED